MKTVMIKQCFRHRWEARFHFRKGRVFYPPGKYPGSIGHESNYPEWVPQRWHWRGGLMPSSVNPAQIGSTPRPVPPGGFRVSDWFPTKSDSQVRIGRT